MLRDVSRITDVKRIFYRFVTVFIAVSQPHSDQEMLCKVSFQVVSLPWSVSFSHIRNEQKNGLIIFPVLNRFWHNLASTINK